MNEQNLQKCKLVLLGDDNGQQGKGIIDDQMSCNKIESILPILLHPPSANSSLIELLQLIHPCLKSILQYWTQGTQSINNKWSKSCIGLATALAIILPIEKTGDYSKYYKLLGFVLAKATVMATEEKIITYIDALFNHFTLKNLNNDLNLMNMIPIYYRLLLDLLSRFRNQYSSTASVNNNTHGYEEQHLGRLLIKSQNLDILASLISTTPTTSDQRPEKNSNQKLFDSFLESCILWSSFAESCILKDSGSLSLSDIDQCRSNVFHILATVSCGGGLILTISELITRQISPLMKQDPTRIHTLSDQMNQFIACLDDQLVRKSGIYSGAIFENEIISQCRAILHWIYELKSFSSIPQTSKKTSGVSKSKTTKSKSNSTSKTGSDELVDQSFQISFNFVTHMRKYSIELGFDQSRWEWALLNDLTHPHSLPQEFPSSELDLSSLTNLDKGLISRLLISTISQQSITPIGPESHTVVWSILVKFINSSSNNNNNYNNSRLEYSSKLLSLSFQTILNQEIDSDINGHLLLDLLSLTFQFLSESLSLNIPLVDYLLKILPQALSKLLPLHNDITSLFKTAHSLLIQSVCSYLSSSMEFLSNTSSPQLEERQKILATTFPIIWSQFNRVWSDYPTFISFDYYIQYLVLCEELFGLIFENIPEGQQDQLAGQFCQHFLSFAINNKSTEISSTTTSQHSEILCSNFTERWMSHIELLLEPYLEKIWMETTDWSSFYEKSQNFFENITKLITNKFSSPSFTIELTQQQLFILNLSSKLCWKYQNRQKSNDCQSQYQRISEELRNKLTCMGGDSCPKKGKKGTEKKNSLGLDPISRFKCLVLQIHWKFSEINDSEITATSSLSNAASIGELAEVVIAHNTFKEIQSLTNLNPLVVYDFIENTYQFYHILSLTGDFTITFEFLNLLIALSKNEEDDNINQRISLCKLSIRLKFTLLAWCLFNACFEEFYLVKEVVVFHENINEDLETSLMNWIESAASFFLLLLERQESNLLLNDDNLTSFQVMTEKVYKLCKFSHWYVQSSWIALIFSKIHLFFSNDLSTTLLWSKNSLSKKEVESTFNTSIDTLEIEMEAILQISDIYECLGMIEKCFSYLSEAKILSSSGLGQYTYLTSIYTLHALRIWKRTGSSRFESELEKATINYPKTNKLNSIRDKIYVSCDIIRNISIFHTMETNVQDKFQYRYLNMMWNISRNQTNQQMVKYHAPLNLHVKKLLSFTKSEMSSHLSSPSPSLPLFSGFSSLSEEIISKLFSPEQLLKTYYFDIQRDSRRNSATSFLFTSFDKVNQTLERINPLPQINSISFQNFLVWFFASTSCSTSIENSLPYRSESERVPFQKLTSQLQDCYYGDILALHNLKDFLQKSCRCKNESSNLAICDIIFDHMNSRVLLTRLDHQNSFTIALGLNTFQSLKQLLIEWDKIMESNKNQLAQTSDPVKVQSWKSSDKKRWWLERDNLDLQIQRVLDSFEETIGVWRCLFTSSNSLNISETVIDSIRNWFCQVISSNKKASKIPNKSVSEQESEWVEEKINGLIPWLQLVLSKDALTDECDQITATNDLLTWLLSLSHIQLDSDMILQRSIQLVREVNLVPNTIPSPQIHGIDELTERLSSLKVVDLKSELKSYGLDVTGKKGELHERLLNHLKSSLPSSDDSMNSNPSTEGDSNTHIVLIPDELFQLFPLECLPSLRLRSCSRIPSLLLLLNKLENLQESLSNGSDENDVIPIKGKSKSKARKGEESKVHCETTTTDGTISLSKCWYTIDPDANLVNTRDTLMTFMETYIMKWNWRGYSGCAPPEDSVREHHENSDLFVYCGHGSGDKLFTGNNRLSKLKCPAAMLWGCSSGALTRHGVHDPIGAPVTYLFNGAPWVIGNLWDVTDKDLDKLSIACMERVFDDRQHGREGDEDNRNSNGNSNGDSSSNSNGNCNLQQYQVSNSLCLSREVCKLKCAVGSAPVLYGIPVRIKHQ